MDSFDGILRIFGVSFSLLSSPTLPSSPFIYFLSFLLYSPFSPPSFFYVYYLFPFFSLLSSVCFPYAWYFDLLQNVWEKVSWPHLYSFPVASITNCYKLGGLKQHVLIPLQFWRSEVWNQFPRMKLKFLISGLCCSRGPRRISFHAFFWLWSCIPCIFWLKILFFSVVSSNLSLLRLWHCLFSSVSDLSLPLLGQLWSHLGLMR